MKMKIRISMEIEVTPIGDTKLTKMEAVENILNYFKHKNTCGINGNRLQFNNIKIEKESKK
jgi:hypothetical protein